MPLIVANKRVHARGKEIRNFIKFMNQNHEIPHSVLIHILNFPCVYDSMNQPAFGLFYAEKGEVHIELANDIEWYKKIHRQKFSQQFLHYLILSSLAYEICHYFQFRDNKPLIENYVEHNGMKLLKEYVFTKKGILTQRYISQIANGTVWWTDEDICAIDPIKLFRKRAKSK